MKAKNSNWYRYGWTLDIKNQSWVEDTENQVDFIIRTLGLNGSERILDLACGCCMTNLKIVNIREVPDMADVAAKWFHDKWSVPVDAYRESMTSCITGKDAVPLWYIVMNDNDRIIGGIGVIENDFHDRKDLTPNVCAVYVENEYRCQGIAGRMLQRVCLDMHDKGIDTLYLITEHTSFYERYGWEFLCMVQGDGEEQMSRMYIHEYAN